GGERAAARRAAAEPAARARARAGAKPRRGRFRGAQPRRDVSELLDLTAAQAAERVRHREVSAGELFDLYRERARAEDLGAFLWVSDGEPDQPQAHAPLGRGAGAVKRPVG